MKQLVILSENAKGLFTDKESQNDLSTEVAKLFDSGETKVKVEANGKTLILVGYLKRGATSANSAFTYRGETRNYICKQLREYFGLPLYSKPHSDKFSPCVNIHLATKEELQNEIKRLQEQVKKLEEEEKEAKLDKDLQNALQNISKADLLKMLQKQSKKNK